ncbi:hypothetical protein TNCV_1225131 [Trichonephila clavipes]|nr:hypothetical protein TNCV_1225131 [Trichonephila clavipes]
MRIVTGTPFSGCYESCQERYSSNRVPHHTTFTSVNRSYSMCFGNGTRNFEPWASDEDNTLADTPIFPTTPAGGRLSLDIFNVHRPPLHGGFSAVSTLNSRHASHESVT